MSVRHVAVEGGFLLRLEIGEKLPDALQDFCLSRGIPSATAEGLGALRDEREEGVVLWLRIAALPPPLRQPAQERAPRQQGRSMLRGQELPVGGRPGDVVPGMEPDHPVRRPPREHRLGQPPGLLAGVGRLACVHDLPVPAAARLQVSVR